MNPSRSAATGGRSRSETGAGHSSPPVDSELAEHIAERLRAEEAQRLYASRLEHLHRISLAILSADSLASVVQIAVGYIEETIPCLVAGISLYDAERAEAAIVRSSDTYWPPGSRLPITRSRRRSTTARAPMNTVEKASHTQKSPWPPTSAATIRTTGAYTTRTTSPALAR